MINLIVLVVSPSSSLSCRGWRWRRLWRLRLLLRLLTVSPSLLLLLLSWLIVSALLLALDGHHPRGKKQVWWCRGYRCRCLNRSWPTIIRHDRVQIETLKHNILHGIIQVRPVGCYGQHKSRIMLVSRGHGGQPSQQVRSYLLNRAQSGDREPGFWGRA